MSATRWVSGVELLLGAGLVIGHNVFRVLPNEVLILAALGLISARLRNGSWLAFGFKRPALWRTVILIALAAVALRIILGEYVIDPLTSRFWPEAVAPSGADEITGNLRVAALWLLLVWTFAAFGEEIAYRGYLLNRAADVAGGSTLAWWTGVIVIALLFGYGHFYKGPAGILDSGIAGLILGAAYVLSGRNLWTCVLAHGFIDTVGIIALYFGLDF
jgi:uncharacterized protein